MADPERITVSVETLRAELAQLELRMYERITSALSQKADVLHLEQLEARVQSLELSRAARESMGEVVTELVREAEQNKRLRYAIPSVAFLALCLAAFSLALNYL